MEKFSFLYLMFLVCSCVPNTFSGHKFSNVKPKFEYFYIKTYSSNFEERSKFRAIIPKGGKKNMLFKDYRGGYMEYVYNYKDGAVFYISNDIWSGARSNMANLYRVGITGYSRGALLDTLSYYGSQEDGRFWKELLLGEIIVGYLNTNANSRIYFDQALLSTQKVR